MAKHRRNKPRKGSQNAGRPRKDGARYPGGKLKPPAPNARVIAERAALLGRDKSLEAADNPLDLAWARGWISERQHRAAQAFADAHRKAGLDAPGLDGGGLQGVEESLDIQVRTWADLSSAEITAIFDKVMGQTPPGVRETRAAIAMELWTRLCRAMTPDELRQVELLAVHKSWPQWIILRCNAAEGTDFADPAWAARAGSWEARRLHLVSGLDKIARELWPKAKRPEAPPRTPEEILAQPGKALSRPRGPKLNQVTQYVDEEGAPVLEVVRKVRP